MPLIALTREPIVSTGLCDGRRVLVGHPKRVGHALQARDGELVCRGVTGVDHLRASHVIPRRGFRRKSSVKKVQVYLDPLLPIHSKETPQNMNTGISAIKTARRKILDSPGHRQDLQVTRHWSGFFFFSSLVLNRCGTWKLCLAYTSLACSIRSSRCSLSMFLNHAMSTPLSRLTLDWRTCSAKLRADPCARPRRLWQRRCRWAPAPELAGGLCSLGGCRRSTSARQDGGFQVRGSLHKSGLPRPPGQWKDAWISNF